MSILLVALFAKDDREVDVRISLLGGLRLITNIT